MLRTSLLVLAWLVVAALGLVVLARLFAHDASFPLITLNAFTPWLFLPVWVVLVAALLARKPELAAASGILALVHLVWTLPGTLAAATPPAGDDAPRVRVMAVNLLYVHPRPEEILDEIRAEDPDVLVLTELSPLWIEAFERDGLLDRYPERIFEVRADSFGAGIFSRLPLSDEELVDLGGVPLPRATLDVGGKAVRLYAVHPLPPRTRAYAAVWQEQMAALDALLREETLPLIAAGDFNATPQSRWYQALVRGRLRGAHEDRGRGLASTWPNGMFPLPPVRLDHVLLSPELGCTAVREGEGRGSDHRPVIADLVLLDA